MLVVIEEVATRIGWLEGTTFLAGENIAKIREEKGVYKHCLRTQQEQRGGGETSQ